MQIPRLDSVWQFLLFAIGLSFSGTTTLAQIVPDNTLNTQVDSNGNVIEITGGQTRGDNLFHSFQDFSVRIGNEAFFNNAENISNIFSRVTGSSISNIDGLIRANGDASLFLINPNGIIFGEGSRLDIGGSFLSSTAESIVFADGEFSATDIDTPPLLTINAPIGLNLGSNPGAIVNRSTVEDSEGNSVGLEVLEGNNLSLVGGEIVFEGGKATARGGKIELGGLAAAGTVSINEDGGLTFSDDIAKADVFLNNSALIDASSRSGGDIVIHARNLELTENTFVKTGIRAEPDFTDADDVRGGDIKIDLTGKLTLDLSRILNQVEPNGVGNAGQIVITTGSIAATNGGQIDATTSGRGNAGNITINATGDLIFDGEGFDNLDSSIVSLVNENAVGDAGDVTIYTEGNLNLTNGGRVDVSSNSRGNGGNITISTMGDLSFIGEDSEELGSGVTSLVNPQAAGDSGNITISTKGNLTLTNRGRIDVSNNSTSPGNAGNATISVGGNLTIDGEKNFKGFGSGIVSVVNESQGDSGDINISTEGNLNLTNGGQISTNVNAQGNGGDITINAMGDITFDGDDINGDGSGAISLIGQGIQGNAGDITISTQGKLSLTGGGRVDASSNRGEGNAGSVEIVATDDIFFAGEDSRGFGSGATSQVNPGVAGNSGGITIFTQRDLTLKDGGRVDTSTNALGNAGFIDITALGDITFEGKAINGEGSGVTSQVNPQATGNAGRITISTQENLILKDWGRVDVSINALGDGDNPGESNAERANIVVQVANNIFMDGNSLISAQAIGNANGGNLNIDAEFIVVVPNSNSDIIADAEQGQGGNITIDARSLFGIEERPLDNLTNDINASSEFGLSGMVEIDILEVDPSQDSLDVPVVPIEIELAQTCEPSRNGDRSELVVTGRSGLPDSAESNLNGGFVLEDWRVEDSSGTVGRSPEHEPRRNVKRVEPIVEADGWVVDRQGKVVLIADNPHREPSSLTKPAANCSVN